MKIAITGSTGYIGKSLALAAINSGYDLVCLSRICHREFMGEWLHFDISSIIVPPLPINTKVVVHLAILKEGGISDLDNQEILVARSLMAEAKRVGAKFIFISSQTARVDAPTLYGRRKWIIEQDVISAGGTVVRPGLVYGGDGNGLFGELCKLVRRFYLLPNFCPSPKIQPIHIEDLVAAILKISNLDTSVGKVFHLGSVLPVMFTDFLKALAKNHLNVWRVFVPFPSMIIIWSRPIFNGFTSLARLNSLFDLPIMKTSDDLAELDIVLRGIDLGMRPSINSNERLLVQEATALYSYVMKVTPSSREIARYLSAIRQLRGGLPLQLPIMFINYPIMLSLLEGHIKSLPHSKFTEEFQWRINATMRIAEATIYGAKRFSGLGTSNGKLKSCIGIFLAIFKSVIIFMLARIFAPYFGRILPDRGGN